MQHMLKILVKLMDAWVLVPQWEGTPLLCHTVLVYHFAGYSVACFAIQTGHSTVFCHCALFSGVVCNFATDLDWRIL